LELQDRVERLEASQKALEKQRKQQKINDITSATVSLSSLTHSATTPSVVAAVNNTSLSSSLVTDPAIVRTAASNTIINPQFESIPQCLAN